MSGDMAGCAHTKNFNQVTQFALFRYNFIVYPPSLPLCLSVCLSVCLLVHPSSLILIVRRAAIHHSEN